MVWVIHVREDKRRFEYVNHELHSAIAIACLLLRDGINVESIEGPDGMRLDVDAIRPMCETQGRLTRS